VNDCRLSYDALSGHRVETRCESSPLHDLVSACELSVRAFAALRNTQKVAAVLQLAEVMMRDDQHNNAQDLLVTCAQSSTHCCPVHKVMLLAHAQSESSCCLPTQVCTRRPLPKRPPIPWLDWFVLL
jgi:hypothetical protein